jgi:hypothetical protein
MLRDEIRLAMAAQSPPRQAEEGREGAKDGPS